MDGLQRCRATECKPRGARRWIPLSLKAYCALLVALGAGSVSLVALRVYRYEAAVAETERVGGTTSSPRGAATWRVERAFEVVRKVDLSGSSITDDGLKSVAGLDGIQSLVLRNTQIGDAGIARLTRQKSLGHLDLRGTQITDAGLPALSELIELRDLYLGGTKVTDAGLTGLYALSKLDSLDLDDTQVSDQGLEQLKGLRSLRQLMLSGTRVTDAGVAHLAVTDEGIADLKRALPKLDVSR